MTIKLCLIGIGNFGNVLYKKIQDITDFEIVHCYHYNEEKAKKLFQERGTSDIYSALKDVDGVIIATPNDQHFENIKQCLKANKHIFVEKPLTSKYEDALKLSPFLKEDKVFMVGHNYRRESVFRHAKKIIDEGKLGKIVSVYFNVSHGGAFSFNPNQWRYSSLRHREGPLITAGVHVMDTVHYLFGKVDNVYARICNISKQTDAPDSNAVILGMKSNTSVFIQTNYNIPSEEICVIYGTEGIIYIDRDSLSLRIGRDSRINNVFTHSKTTPIKLKKTDSIKEELEEFRDAIKSGKKIETGFIEGLNSLAIIEACYQSNMTKRVVLMKEFDY